MLNLYLSNSPIDSSKVVVDIDAWFTRIGFSGDELDRRFISEIDHGSYVSGATFTDRFGVNLYVDCLSTGCKTALLTNNCDMIIDLAECGQNARDAILTLGHRGAVLMHYDDNRIQGTSDEIDILFLGKYHFTSLGRLNDFLDYEWVQFDTPDIDTEGVEVVS